MLNPVLVPFVKTSNGTTLSADISQTVQGGYPGSVSVLLSANLTVVQPPPGMTGIPGFLGSTPVTELASLTLAAGSTVALSLPQAKAIVAGGVGSIVSYN